MAPAATTPGAKSRGRFGQNLFRQRPTSRLETGFAAFLAGALKKTLLLKLLSLLFEQLLGNFGLLFIPISGHTDLG